MPLKATSESRVQAIDAKIDGVRNDLHSFKTEVATLFNAVRGEIANLRTDIIEKLGNLKIWVLLTAAGTAGSLISLLLNVASVIRGWQSH